MENVINNEVEESIKPCFSCFYPNVENAKICEKCGILIGRLSGNDPVQNLVNEGAVYGKATEIKPNKLVLLAVWLLFFPALIISSLNIVASILGMNGGGSEGVLIFWLMVITAGFSFMMLYRVSKNYFYPKDRWKEDEKEAIENS